MTAYATIYSGSLETDQATKIPAAVVSMEPFHKLKEMHQCMKPFTPNLLELAKRSRSWRRRFPGSLC